MPPKGWVKPNSSRQTKIAKVDQSKFLFTQVELSLILSYSTNTIGSFVNSGGLKTDKSGKIDIRDAFQFMSDKIKADLKQSDIDYEEQRARKMKIDADLSEIDLMKACGKVVEIEKVEAFVEKFVMNVRNQLLPIPKKIANYAAFTSDAIDIEQNATLHVYGALNQLAEMQMDYHDKIITKEEPKKPESPVERPQPKGGRPKGSKNKR